MPTLGLVNIAAVASGVLSAPRLEAEAILVEDGRISAIGAASKIGAGRADVVVDCLGTTVIPGLIDSHCHVVLGDYTPRQKTVDFLDSYVHGGITSVVSAGEGVHAPGRPHDAAASKALAIAAAKCFEHFHPNGMKVNAGSVVLEPGLTDDDFAEMARHGVRHAKYGFGGYAQPQDGEPEVRRAQKHGMCVMSHSGGSSIPGSSPINHEVLLHLKPDVCGHVNGGTTSLDEAGIDRIIAESTMALQIVQAGNLRAALHIVKRARAADVLARVCIASDTPTGTGVMPLGVMKSVCEVASLGELAPEQVIALATGNNARAFRLARGLGTLAVGAPADLVVCDAPSASLAADALTAIARGDIPGISCVVIDGQVRVGRSRNTPMAKRMATFTGVAVAGAGH
ncbi:MAG TPA: amidohydrolase family protein [Methylomirabilota bacterium]|jgi:enamidase|nr:amidohydrolase family protein [Methylomirabilota bacterium]